ncbi:hypothetical protein ACWGKS_26925 [Nocardiopsis sp. NPDC055879]
MNHATPTVAVPLSLTVGALPTSAPVRVYDIPLTVDHTHHLVVIDEAATIDLAVHAFRALTAPVRSLLFVALDVPDPDTDPAGYRAARWWAPSQTFTLDLIRGMEQGGRLDPWPGNSDAQGAQDDTVEANR